MNADELLSAAGLWIYRTKKEPESFRICGDLGLRVARFSRFQKHVLEQSVFSGVAAHLIAFELLDPSKIPVGAWSEKKLYRTTRGVHVELAIAGVLSRVLLSVPTQLSIANGGLREMCVDKGSSSWTCGFQEYAYLSKDKLSQEILLDQMAWAFRYLPPPLFGHLCGLRSLTALPSDTWLREDTGCTKKLDPDFEEAINRQMEVFEFVEMRDELKRLKGGEEIISHACALLSFNQKESPSEHLSRWFVDLVCLRGQIINADEVTLMVVAWMLDLVESGTIKKGSASHFKTRARYARTAAKALWRNLSAISKDVRNWSSSDIGSAYLATLMEPGSSDKQILAAATGSFRVFASDFFDVPHGDVELSNFAPEIQPRAQIVTEAELIRACEWVEKLAGEDQGLALSLVCALRSAWAAPFRLTELLHLRKRNVTRLQNGHYIVEIVAWSGHTSLKTETSMRRMNISCEMACAALDKLVDWRNKQGWTSGDLLFGDAQVKNRVYRRSTLITTLLRVLKHTTGDPCMTFHALRHAWATRQVHEVLTTSSLVDWNRLTHVAAEMGHATPHTTLLFYSHRFEEAMRLHICIAMQQTLDLCAKSLSGYLQCNEDAIRKQASRAAQPLREFGWKALENRAASIEFTPLWADLQMSIPKCPALGITTTRRVTAWTVFHVLQELTSGTLSEHQVAARHRMSPVTVKEMVAKLHRLANLRGRQRMGRKDLYVEVSDTALATMLLDISFHASTQQKFQYILPGLQNLRNDSLEGLEDAWTALRTVSGHWNASHHRALWKVLETLRQLGARAGDLCLCSALSRGNPKLLLKKAETLKVFAAVFGEQPLQRDDLSSRTDRPDLFVTWPTHKGGVPNFSSAASSIKGADAILVAAIISHDAQLGEINAIA